jgi:universal stress protein A
VKRKFAPNGGNSLKIKRILVPVDFSEHSIRAVDHAIEFAKAFDSEIDLIHCHQITPSSVAPFEASFPASMVEDMRKSAEAELATVRERVEAAGITVTAHLSLDFPSNAIETAARDLGADLIIMGTRGLTGLKHVLLGSVAERTVRIAPCPVLTIGESSANDES